MGRASATAAGPGVAADEIVWSIVGVSVELRHRVVRLCRSGPERLLLVYSAPLADDSGQPIDAQDAADRASCRIWGVTLDVHLE